LGPKEIPGTKQPSITSKWIHSAPEDPIRATPPAIEEKSAESTEGAIMGIRILLLMIPTQSPLVKNRINGIIKKIFLPEYRLLFKP
jgi:hypothetical protein